MHILESYNSQNTLTIRELSLLATKFPIAAPVLLNTQLNKELTLLTINI